MRQVPTFGLVIAIMIVLLAVYVSTRVESSLLKFLILFFPVLIVVSAFLGLAQENKIVGQVAKAGYIDQYVAAHGVGTQKAFKEFIRELKDDGYTINPRMEKVLWEEIKKKAGYNYQNSV